MSRFFTFRCALLRDLPIFKGFALMVEVKHTAVMILMNASIILVGIMGHVKISWEVIGKDSLTTYHVYTLYTAYVYYVY